MRNFFAKHGGVREPSEAIELLIQKLLKARDMVNRGDENHLHELKELSDMIDDYVSQAQGQKFEPKPFVNYEGRGIQNPENNYDRRGGGSRSEFHDYPDDRRRTSGNIGYVPHISPFPPYGEDRRNGSEGYDYEYRRR